MADLVMLRGVAWSTFASLTAAGTTIGVAAVVLTSQIHMLLMLCSALLAAGAAFLLDEPSCAVTDVTASRERQTLVRARLLIIPLALSGLLIAVSPQDDVRRPGLILAFSGALLLAFTVARCLREASGLPGSMAATISMGVCVVPALLGSLSPLQTFPGTGEGGPVIGSDLWWTVSDVVCAATVGALILRSAAFPRSQIEEAKTG